MTVKEADRQIKQMNVLAKEMKKDPELARRLVMRTGMYTPTGQLKKQFR